MTPLHSDCRGMLLYCPCSAGVSATLERQVGLVWPTLRRALEGIHPHMPCQLPIGCPGCMPCPARLAQVTRGAPTNMIVCSKHSAHTPMGRLAMNVLQHRNMSTSRVSDPDPELSTTMETAAKIEHWWKTSPRWTHVTRPYTAAQVNTQSMDVLEPGATRARGK